MNILTAAIIVAVVLALVLFLWTRLNDLRASGRRERLEILDARIKDFYGPLYVVSSAVEVAHRAMAAKLGGDGVKLPKPASEEQYEELRLWVTHVLMPMYQWCEKPLLDHTHLMVERETPECVLRFLAHVSAYKVVIEKWADDDFSEWEPPVAYPSELKEYASKTYLALKDEQLSLIRGLQ